MSRSESQPDNLRELVAEVAAAYFGRSPVDSAEISDVIAQIATSLGAIGDDEAAAAGSLAGKEPRPAVERETPQIGRGQIRKSITPDALISFEDGKPYRTLRLHLASRGLTPEAYREKWGLPADYPMVAPNYSAVRSRMAKKLGLGRRNAASPEAAKETAPATRTTGRKRR